MQSLAVALASSPRDKSETLDLIRAVAALSVVVFHMRGLAGATGVEMPGAQLGEAGVQLFFVLSGYLITNSVTSRSFTPRRYAVNRAFRILPAYYASILVVLVFQNAAFLTDWSGWKILGSHAVLLQNFFRPHRLAVNRVLWTLSLEWCFYLLMLAGAPALRNRRARWWFVGALFAVPLAYRASVAYRYEGMPATLNFYSKQLPGVLDQFACGVFAALLLSLEPVRSFVSRRAVAVFGVVAAVGALLVALALYYRHAPNLASASYWQYSYMIILWPIVFCAGAALLVVFLQQFEPTLAPWVRRTGLGFVGVFSYSLYLFHPLVVDTFVDGFDAQEATIPGAAYFALAFAAIIGTAIVSYRLIERPFMNMRQRFLARSPRTEVPELGEPEPVGALLN